MAESLRVRDTTNTDPALRATAGTSALRQDGFVAPQHPVISASLSARVRSYASERATWTVGVTWAAGAATNASTPASGADPNVSEIQVRYAWDGYPEFWGEGQLLDSQTPDHSMLATLIHDNVSATQSLSNWLYYSLLYKYIDSAGRVYTKRVATTSVLVPTAHDNASSMWRRIPRYYRLLDTSGHLERYLGIFGWEADQLRSLADELAAVRDPYRVHYDSLTSLAASVGLPFTAQELRPHQLRELIHNSHRYVAQRGRVDALIDMLSIITDSEVSCREFSTTGSNTTANYRRAKFSLSASRLNLISDPRFAGAPSSSGAWNYLTSASAGSITVDHSAATGVTFSTNSSGAGTVYVFPRTAAQVKRKVPYYSSVEASMTNATGKVRLYREEPTNASSLPGYGKFFSTDDATYTDYYKDLSLVHGRYSTSSFAERSGFVFTPAHADTAAVFLTAGVNGTLFRARLYGADGQHFAGFNLRLTRVDSHPSSDNPSGRFDRFNIAVHSDSGSSSAVIDPQTSSSDTNFTINTSGELINEDDSNAVVTKLTQTTGGVDYILLIDSVATITYAAATQLPSDDTSIYPFRQTGVEQLFPTIVLTLSNSSSVTLDKWMFEPFSNGPYFDGSTQDGYSYVSGGSVVSDYEWRDAANNSVSSYTPLRLRNREAVRTALTDNLPVTMSTELTASNYYTSTSHGYVVAFDGLPGDERAFDPHSWSAGVYSEGTILTNSD